MNDKKRGLFILGTDNGDRQLGADFLRSPREFARKHGLDPNDFSCPEEAHSAFARGQSFADDAADLTVRPDGTGVSDLEALANTHFRGPVDAEVIPFGLRFRERANVGLEWTATGSGTLTFLESDADVDG